MPRKRWIAGLLAASLAATAVSLAAAIPAAARLVSQNTRLPMRLHHKISAVPATTEDAPIESIRVGEQLQQKLLARIDSRSTWVLSLKCIKTGAFDAWTNRGRQASSGDVFLRISDSGPR
jgi:hypothetical protein